MNAPIKCGGLSPKQWRTLPWLPGYEISEDGDVRHTTRKATRPAGYVLKGGTCNGYRIYKLPVGGVKRIYSAHRLVCEAWHGHKRNVLHREAAHNDGNRANNHYSNLRWASRTENNADRKAHGTDPVGERNPRARLNWGQVSLIRERYTGARGEITALAREFGVSHGAMCAVLDGRHWRV
jgi:hypothetical protein